jgi:hypothetical protein
MRNLWVIGIILAAIVALGAWTLTGQQPTRRAPEQNAPVAPAPPSVVWTSDARAQLRAEVVKRNEGTWPAYLATDDARGEMIDCFVGKLIAGMPGGPSDWQRLGSEGKKLEELTARAGFACGREYSDRITSATSWSASFTPVFASACVQVDGEELRAACACIAEQAPARFSSPAEFMGVYSTPRTKRTPADQKRLGETFAKCADRAPSAEALAKLGK